MSFFVREREDGILKNIADSRPFVYSGPVEVKAEETAVIVGQDNQRRNLTTKYPGRLGGGGWYINNPDQPIIEVDTNGVVSIPNLIIEDFVFEDIAVNMIMTKDTGNVEFTSPIEMGGNDISGVGTLTATTIIGNIQDEDINVNTISTATTGTVEFLSPVLATDLAVDQIATNALGYVGFLNDISMNNLNISNVNMTGTKILYSPDSTQVNHQSYSVFSDSSGAGGVKVTDLGLPAGLAHTAITSDIHVQSVNSAEIYIQANRDNNLSRTNRICGTASFPATGAYEIMLSSDLPEVLAITAAGTLPSTGQIILACGDFVDIPDHAPVMGTYDPLMALSDPEIIAFRRLGLSGNDLYDVGNATIERNGGPSAQEGLFIRDNSQPQSTSQIHVADVGNASIFLEADTNNGAGEDERSFIYLTQDGNNTAFSIDNVASGTDNRFRFTAGSTAVNVGHIFRTSGITNNGPGVIPTFLTPVDRFEIGPSEVDTYVDFNMNSNEIVSCGDIQMASTKNILTNDSYIQFSNPLGTTPPAATGFLAFVYKSGADLFYKNGAATYNLNRPFLNLFTSYDESLALSSTASTTFQTKLSVTTAVLPIGDYDLGFGCIFWNSMAAQITEVRFRLDGVDLNSIVMTAGVISETAYQRYRATFGSATTHTLAIEWRTQVMGTANIQDARIFVDQRS